MTPRSLTKTILNSVRPKTHLNPQNPTPNISSRSYLSNRDNGNIPTFGVPKEKVDCLVIGAGVVGIAIARALALKGRQVLVVESSNSFGTVTSSRNSEVIHAGIYYPPHSLKAKFCVEGREILYRYCSERDVPHKQLGKLIVATRESEIPKLNELLDRGANNGVEGLRLMEASEAMSREPELQCGEAENHGAIFSYNTTVLEGHIQGGDMNILVTGTPALENVYEGDKLHADLVLVPKVVINSAGLTAVALARRLIGSNNSSIPDAYFARGHYFSLSNMRVPPFSHLIYPIPEDGGLGVHVTLDLDGHVKFGPDVEWIGGVDDIASFLNRFDYSVHPEHAERFYPEIKKYYPNLKHGSLEPGYAGIRPKLCGPGQTPSDFVIQGEDVHGVPGLVNLFGIESPGLTASMAIAEHVTERVLHTK